MLNPTQEYTYNVLREIFNETFNTFPDEYLHLGMDEVYYKCWSVSSVYRQELKEGPIRWTSFLMFRSTFGVVTMESLVNVTV